jgi:hypothetical protein
MKRLIAGSWVPFVLIAAIVVLLVLVIATRSNASVNQKPPVTEQIARTITKTWTCQDAIGQSRTKAGNVWAKHSPGYRRYQLRIWQARLEQCRQWNWKSWLPANWRALAVCETGLNWRHYNGGYRSAFGISTREYDRDASYKGVRPWFVKGKPPPTPWEQYQAALGHYERFGDGWGCPGP